MSEEERPNYIVAIMVPPPLRESICNWQKEEPVQYRPYAAPHITLKRPFFRDVSEEEICRVVGLTLHNVHPFTVYVIGPPGIHEGENDSVLYLAIRRAPLYELHRALLYALDGLIDNAPQGKPKCEGSRYNPHITLLQYLSLGDAAKYWRCIPASLYYSTFTVNEIYLCGRKGSEMWQRVFPLIG